MEENNFFTIPFFHLLQKIKNRKYPLNYETTNGAHLVAIDLPKAEVKPHQMLIS